jgi:putative phage-type endonuclease
METTSTTTQLNRELIQPIIDEALKNGRSIPTTQMDKTVWLGIRKVLGIGGSEAAVVLGISRYKTPYQLWQEKVSEEIEEISNKFTLWGNLLEEPIAQAYMRETGNIVIADNKIRIHPKYDCLFTNLDRVIMENGKETGCVECKSTVKSVYNSWEANEDDNPQGIPLEHYIQVQDELACSGLPFCDYVVLLVDQREIRIKRILPDPEFIEKMETALVGWWNAYVVTNEAPPMTVKEYAFVAPQEESFIEATGEIAELYNSLKEKKGTAKILDKEIGEMEDKIKEFIGEKANLVLIDTVIATWKQQSRSGIDSKLLKSKYPEISREVEKVSTFRVLKLKEIK